jgi:hypothetical protein
MDKLFMCPVNQKVLTPCNWYRSHGVCPSSVVIVAHGDCPIKNQRRCRRCEGIYPPDDFYGDDKYCKVCRKAATLKSKGGLSHRKIIAVCDVDGEPCPKSTGIRCNKCPKTSDNASTSDNPAPPTIQPIQTDEQPPESAKSV